MEAPFLPDYRTRTVVTTMSSILSTTTTTTTNSTCEPTRIKALGGIQLFFAAISLLGSLSMICYLIRKRIFGTREVRPLFHLVCADAGLAAFLILSATIWKYSCELPCEYFQIFAEMFYLITFLLTANYALNVYIRMKDRYHRANNLVLLRESKYHNCSLCIGYLFCWIAPVISVLPALIAAGKPDKIASTISELPALIETGIPYTCYSLFFNITTESQSWNKYGTVLFLTTLLSSLLAIIIFYTLTTRVYKKLLRQQNEFTNRQRHSVRELQKRVTLYIGVFVFCWTPASVLAIIGLCEGNHLLNDCSNTLFALYVLQSVTAPSQGFLNSIVYGWTRRSVYSFNEPTEALNRQTFRGYGSSATKRIYPQKPEPSRPVSEETTALDQYEM